MTPRYLWQKTLFNTTPFRVKGGGGRVLAFFLVMNISLYSLGCVELKIFLLNAGGNRVYIFLQENIAVLRFDHTISPANGK